MSPTLPHQLLIPSTWIAVAMGDSFLLKDMVWVMLADVACICVTASWFLRRVFPSLPVCWTVLLTAGYAVGGFFQTKYGFMQFLDHAAMFPLFALGLYRLVNGGRGWLYAAGLFLLATSLYSAFMAVVTGWLFAWAFTLPLKGTRERRVRLARVFWYTAAVTLATCYYWLPMAEMSRDSMRSLFMTPPTFLNCHGRLTLPNSWNAFTPVCRGCHLPLWRRFIWLAGRRRPLRRTEGGACLSFFWRRPFCPRLSSPSTAPPIYGATWIFPSGSVLFPIWR